MSESTKHAAGFKTVLAPSGRLIGVALFSGDTPESIITTFLIAPATAEAFAIHLQNACEEARRLAFGEGPTTAGKPPMLLHNPTTIQVQKGLGRLDRIVVVLDRDQQSELAFLIPPEGAEQLGRELLRVSAPPPESDPGSTPVN